MNTIIHTKHILKHLTHVFLFLLWPAFSSFSAQIKKSVTEGTESTEGQELIQPASISICLPHYMYDPTQDWGISSKMQCFLTEKSLHSSRKDTYIRKRYSNCYQTERKRETEKERETKRGGRNWWLGGLRKSSWEKWWWSWDVESRVTEFTGNTENKRRHEQKSWRAKGRAKVRNK